MAGVSHGEPRCAERGSGGSRLALPEQRGGAGWGRAAAGKIASIGLSRAGRWVCGCAEGTGRRGVKQPKSGGMLAPKLSRTRWLRDEQRLGVGRRFRAAEFDRNDGTRRTGQGSACAAQTWPGTFLLGQSSQRSGGKTARGLGQEMFLSDTVTRSRASRERQCQA